MTTERRFSDTEINALVDGELTAQERVEMDALVASSPADAGLARELRELNDAMRQRYAGRLEEPVPPAMLAALGRVPRWPAGLATRQATLAAVVVIALLAAAAGYVARGLLAEHPPGPEPPFVFNAISAHRIYVPEVRHPVEVKAAEEHLTRWLTKRVGAPVHAPSLTDVGWRLMGGRLLPDGGQPAAQFMYEDAGGRRLTLYLRKETDVGNTAFRFAEQDGFGAFYWVDRPLAYALAGRLDREEMLALANAVYARLEKR
ncbi:MAG TPA: anti-sigma factor [Hyphomicrobiaceae bacterium]|nr:anti-sigma factor [Hyphomicrobiaceae bacterium]